MLKSLRLTGSCVALGIWAGCSSSAPDSHREVPAEQMQHAGSGDDIANKTDPSVPATASVASGEQDADGTDTSQPSAEPLGATADDAGSKPAASAPAVSPLPAATKGYELFAWDAGGELHFVLITGTNRDKTLDEITASGPSVDTGDFITIRGVGSAALERELARVPAATPVIPRQLTGLPALSAEGRAAVERALQKRSP